jgi:hypothetical protein
MHPIADNTPCYHLASATDGWHPGNRWRTGVECSTQRIRENLQNTALSGPENEVVLVSANQ